MIKKLMKSIREYKKPSILTAAFIVLEVFLEVLIPFFMATLIDKGIDEGEMSVVVKYGIIIICFAILSLTLGALAGKMAARASAGFAKNLRKDTFNKIQGLSFSNIDKFSTSSLITRLTTDVTNVQMAYQMIIRVAVRGPIMLIFSIIMAFNVNSQISMIYLFTIPFLGVGLSFITLKVHPYFVRVFKKYDKLNRVVQENLRGIRVVKTFVREENEIEKFEEVSQEIHDGFIKAEKLVIINGPLLQFTVYFTMIMIAWIGARQVVNLHMTTGELMSLISYSMQILFSLNMLSMVLLMIVISRNSAERIVEVLDEQSDLRNGENPIFEVKDGSIDFENVSFSYSNDKDKLAMSNFNISIKSGETIGVIGGTGSAKTSFVQLIPRLYDVTEGSIKVGGIDVREYDIETLRNQVAMVLQKNILFSGTIKENLRWGNKFASDEEIIHACKLAKAHDFIMEFKDGYDTYIEQGGSNVSGGQRQRLCIARALLKSPKILILDDSTSAVDTKTDSDIRQAFKNEIPNTTKIIIAQRISSVEDADRIIVLESGGINGFGTHKELLETNSIYKEVYESQVKGAGISE